MLRECPHCPSSSSSLPFSTHLCAPFPLECHLPPTCVSLISCRWTTAQLYEILWHFGQRQLGDRSISQLNSQPSIRLRHTHTHTHTHRLPGYSLIDSWMPGKKQTEGEREGEEKAETSMKNNKSWRWTMTFKGPTQIYLTESDFVIFCGAWPR